MTGSETHGRDLESPKPSYNQCIPKGFLRYMNEADHRDYHKLFQAAMPPTLVGDNQAALSDIMSACFSRWTAAETNNAGVVVETAIVAMMFAVMAWLFFGITTDDPRYETLRRLHEKIGYGGGGQYDYREAEPALVEIEQLVFDRSSAAVPGCETILDRILRAQPEAVGEATIRRNLIYMLETGHRDVAGLLTWILKLLSENTLWIAHLRHDLSGLDQNPPDTLGRTLADRVVMETLRLERSEYLYRLARKDVRLGPFKVPKGWIVRICIREGHRTGTAFTEPETFNPGRFCDRNFDRTDYAPFGLYQRRCIGQNISADVCRLFLEALFGRFDMDVVASGPAVHMGGHWQPDVSFRVRLV